MIPILIVVAFILAMVIALTVANNRPGEAFMGAVVVSAILAVIAIPTIAILGASGVGVHSDLYEATLTAQTSSQVSLVANDKIHAFDLNEVELRTGCEGYLVEEQYIDSWVMGFEFPYHTKAYQCVEVTG